MGGYMSTHRLWFWEAQHLYVDQEPIKGVGSGGVGRLRDQPNFCVSITLFTGITKSLFKVREQLKDLRFDPKVYPRTFGYMSAIEKWVTWKPLDYHPPDWPNNQTIRDRIEMLTGIRFANRASLKKWYLDNEHFLIWSPEKQLLIVDVKGKKKGLPAHQFVIAKSDAHSFWLHFVTAVGEFWEWEGHLRHEYFAIEMPVYIVEAPVSVLKAYKAKEGAFLKQLKVYVDICRKFPSIPNELHWGFFAYIRSRTVLKKITDLNFEKPHEWVKWYEASLKKGAFVLNKEGRYLVITSEVDSKANP